MGIKIYNIHTGNMEQEDVCAEAFMRFLYGTAAGKMALWALFKRAVFSRIFGLWSRTKFSAKAIGPFVADKKINMGESLLEVSQFKCWNDFFTRELAEGARPLALEENDRALSFPADGRHLLIFNAGLNDAFYAKGQKFCLKEFFGEGELAEGFNGATMLVSRLSPLDYHRFHYPFSGKICARRFIDGFLSSVSPIALSRDLSILWRNKRVVNLIEVEGVGKCAFVEIGATNVGSIVNFGEVGESVKRGQQAGLFNFGGSCVVTVFPRGERLSFDRRLVEMSARQIECYARVNSYLGVVRSPDSEDKLK